MNKSLDKSDHVLKSGLPQSVINYRELKTAWGRMMSPLVHVYNGDESMVAWDIGTRDTMKT